MEIQHNNNYFYLCRFRHYRDSTASKQAEETLLNSEEMFHTMLDLTYNWEYWLDPDGKFVYTTPSVERLTGYQADEFKRMPRLIKTIIFPEDLAVWECHNQIDGQKAMDKVDEFELRLVKKTVQ